MFSEGPLLRGPFPKRVFGEKQRGKGKLHSGPAPDLKAPKALQMRLSHCLQVPPNTLLLAEAEARLSYSETLRVTSVLGKKITPTENARSGKARTRRLQEASSTKL